MIKGLLHTLSFFLATCLVVACHDDDSNGGGGGQPATPPSGEVPLRSLAGIVRRADAAGLPVAMPGLRVVFDPNGSEERSTSTDADGLFLLAGLPAGTFALEVEGKSAPGFELSSARLAVVIAAAGPSLLARPLVLADLLDPDTAIGTADVDPAAPGLVTTTIDVVGADADVGARILAGTEITLAGVLAPDPVGVAVSEISGTALGVDAPPSGTDATSFVLLTPQDATFDQNPMTPDLRGITLFMPDRRDFGPDSSAQTWYWDEVLGTWTFVQTTDIIGGRVEITSAPFGGLYAATKSLDATCVTTLVGRTVTSTGDPLPGVAVATGFGHAARTGADGTFALSGLPGYSYDLLPGCVGVDFPVDLATDLLAGAQLVRRTPSSVAGATTDLGDVVFTLSELGHVAGLVLDADLGISAPLDIRGPVSFVTASGDDGGFFAARLPAGAYTAETTFSGDTEPTAISFDIGVRSVTTVVLARDSGPVVQ